MVGHVERSANGTGGSGREGWGGTVMRCAAAAVLVAVGCSTGGCSRGPARLAPVKIDAAAAADQALALYDANRDGTLGRDELEKNPALKAAVSGADANHDGAVSREELAQRVRAWQESTVARVSVLCQVRLNGQPLKGATLALVPEKFLAGQLKTCIDTTDDSGMAAPREAGSAVGGVPSGFYRVEISKKEGAREAVPAKYNSQTTLGIEVLSNARTGGQGHVTFNLTNP